MNLRDATEDDVEAIRTVASRSLTTSYSHFLADETIDDAVASWYGESFEDELTSDGTVIVVAETDDGVVGFAQSELVGEGHNTGQILWIHVDPDHRGDGSGVRLLARTREELLESGADLIRATVLERNEEGNEFYRSHGFEEAGTVEIDVGDETHTENVFVERDFDAADGDDGWRSLTPVATGNGDGEVYVSYGEVTRGSDAPFYTAYESDEGTRRYGWFCGNCDSLDNAMDAMGRIECNVCGNRRKATRWDASYL
ncbi:GNAT family N-acetyltransferase [Natronobiforma cellulositropha]|uniref:GNAT family N-acetyltransferase n=1 Tax=Natronobiforma cellulositropha TaxID=1679076 RepID=UPI0021D5C920|nr:GNAT family N-acetyltransferase [Natronobiforma cellulositropha]